MLRDDSRAVQPDTIAIVGGVSPGWADRHRDALEANGIVARFVTDGAALVAALTHDWAIDVVILDLALATPELGARLGITGPRLLAFGDPGNAGIALAANLVDFMPEDIAPDALFAAIAAAAGAPPATGVADLSDQAAARLGALGAEAERIAHALARLARPVADRDPLPVDPAIVRALVKARRAREQFFPAEILSDPAWDMLLDLTAARVEARAVSVSSLCIAAGVPTTTALRWIRNLCDAGLFERTSDPRDARRAFIALAEPTARAMATYLAEHCQPGA